MHFGHPFRIVFFLTFGLILAPENAISQQSQSEPTNSGGPAAGAQLQRQTDRNTNYGPAISTTIDLEFQIVSKRNEIAELLKLDSLIDSFLKSKENIKRAAGRAKDINCDTDYAKLSDGYESASRVISFYWVATQELQKAEGQTFPPILGNFFAASAPERCHLLQEEDQRKSVDAATTQLEEIAKVHQSKLSELRADLYTLQDKLQKALSTQGAIRVAENLPELILIIAGASIAIMLVIRLFSPERAGPGNLHRTISGISA
jgi:hypothetical protein